MSTTETEKSAPATKTVSLGCIYAVKAGMTRVFTEAGDNVSVTVLDLGPNTVVTQLKNKERDGYDAVQFGFLPKKAQRASKAEKNHFQKVGQAGFYHIAELRLPKAEQGLEVGAVASPDFLVEGSYVDVQGMSRGRGFQGVMKRWNFRGNNDSHGHSVSHRSPGSIGNRTDPARVFPGKKMATHMGDKLVSTLSLKVIAYDKDKKILLVNGAVPGAKNGVVRIIKSKKKGLKKVSTKK